MMIGPCPFSCDNRDEFGYCKTTACINYKYRDLVHMMKPSDLITASSACDKCSNNPKNGGTGICHCILGTPQIT